MDEEIQDLPARLDEQDEPVNYPILEAKPTFKCSACLDDRLSRPGTKCYRCDKY